MDINDLIKNGELDVSIKSIKAEHPKDACARRFKDITLFIIAIIMILLVFIFCGYALVSGKFSPDFQKWAMTIAGSIIVGFLGFLTGKHIR
jgi:hypothetical protein